MSAQLAPSEPPDEAGGAAPSPAGLARAQTASAPSRGSQERLSTRLSTPHLKGRTDEWYQAELSLLRRSGARTSLSAEDVDELYRGLFEKGRGAAGATKS